AGRRRGPAAGRGAAEATAHPGRDPADRAVRGGVRGGRGGGREPGGDVRGVGAAPGGDEILVVMARGYTGQVEALLGSRYRKVTAVIEGGLTRPESTRVALSAIAASESGDCGVLLHDAARPLVDQRIIADCVAALREHDAAGVAVAT